MRAKLRKALLVGVVAVMTAGAFGAGYFSQDAYGGLCQWCNAAKPKAGCPAAPCPQYADPCFTGNCTATGGAALGTCQYFALFSTCSAISCPTAGCTGGADICQCTNTSGGC